jgi:1-aminocyclopropane-1-carboxylate deaminase
LRKLKYNLLKQKNQNQQTLLTLRCFSNHIAALAYAAKENGLKVLELLEVRELKNKWIIIPHRNLHNNVVCSLNLWSREVYRNKQNQDFCELEAQFGDFYLVPEGGTNQSAIKKDVKRF